MDFFDIVSYVMACYTVILLASLAWLFWVLKHKDFVTKELPQTEQDLVRFSQRISTRFDRDAIRPVSVARSTSSSRSWVDPSMFNGSSSQNVRQSARLSSRSHVSVNLSTASTNQTTNSDIPVAVSLNERQPTASTGGIGRTVRNATTRPRSQSAPRRQAESYERGRSESVESDSSTASDTPPVRISSNSISTARASINLSAPVGASLDSRRLGQFASVLQSNGLQTFGDLRVLDKDLINTLCSEYSVLERAKLLLLVNEVKGVGLYDEGDDVSL